MGYCPDCGGRAYNGHCVNCHEETYIYEQNVSNEDPVPMSEEFLHKVKQQEKQAKEILKNNKSDVI
ncbi:MAG TPA: hypothetical protein VGB37_10725 [Candidatus Lokiarchaeia archaeon]